MYISLIWCATDRTAALAPIYLTALSNLFTAFSDRFTLAQKLFRTLQNMHMVYEYFYLIHESLEHKLTAHSLPGDLGLKMIQDEFCLLYHNQSLTGGKVSREIFRFISHKPWEPDSLQWEKTKVGSLRKKQRKRETEWVGEKLQPRSGGILATNYLLNNDLGPTTSCTLDTLT